jgi:hypothetical protein
MTRQEFVSPAYSVNWILDKEKSCIPVYHYVKERDNHKCEKCNTWFPNGLSCPKHKSSTRLRIKNTKPPSPPRKSAKSVVSCTKVASRSFDGKNAISAKLDDASSVNKLYTTDKVVPKTVI